MNLSEAVLVTHRACIDGSTCVVVFTAAGGKLENVCFTNPDHEDVDDVVSGLTEWAGPIIIVDVSISKKMAASITRGGFASDDIILLDHHKSAIPLAKFDWCEIEMNNDRCGSKMLYDWVLKHNIGKRNKVSKYKDLVDAVDDRDRWIHNIPESATLASLHKIVGQELFVERFISNSSLMFSNNEKYVIQLDDKRKKFIIANRKENTQILYKDVGEHKLKIGFVMASNHQSELGHSMCSDPVMDCDIAVMVGPNSVSLRSSSGCPVDLSVLATNLGGGGHKNAGGCSLNKLLNNRSLVDIVKDYFVAHDEVWFNL